MLFSIAYFTRPANVFQVQFIEQVSVGIYRADADEEFVGYFTIGIFLGNHLQHLHLTGGKAIRQVWVLGRVSECMITSDTCRL